MARVPSCSGATAAPCKASWAFFEIWPRSGISEASRLVEWILIALGVVLGITFNNRGLLGWLPIVANLEYSVSVFRFKENARGLKIAFLVNMLMYAVSSALIMNFVGAASCIVIAVTTAVSLIKGRKEDSSQDAAGQ